MINGTLFLQIIHFFCAYYIFKNILLKPVLAIIEQEEYEKKCLNIEIVQLKNKTLQLQEHKQELWKECLQKISAIRPSLAMQRYSAEQTKEYNEQEFVSPEQKKQYVDLLSTFLTDQLSRTDNQRE